MAFIGTFSRALLESATAVYFGGVPVSLLDAQGNVILGDNLPDAPTIISTIADRTYEAGDSAVTVDLRTKFDGATSYTVSPSNPAVSIDTYTLTINPAAAMTATTFTVRGINGGGSSAPLTFTLTVTAPLPVLLKPFPDQSLLIGGGTVTLPLAEYFSGATGYAVSPSGQGVTISNGNLIISRTTARDVIITVTATNATGQDTSDSFALLVAAPANQAPVASAIPQQNPTANTAFTADLSSYFVDPEGASLSFDYTGTLPTGITRNGAVFSGTATVTDQTASGVLRARDPGNLDAESPVTWAVAAQPTLQATITPDPLVAGEDFEIVFDPAPDSVSPPSLVRDQSDPTRFTGVAPDSGTLAIGATKAGYQVFGQTYTYDPAPVVLPGSITVESDGTISITIPDGAEPFDVQIAGDVVTIDPAAYTPTSAPVVVGQPDIAGTGGDGEVLTVTGRALFAGHASAGAIALAAGWYRNDTAVGDTDGSYTQDDAVDGDMTLTFRETATNAAGSTVAVSNGVLCPAADIPALPAGLSAVGLFEGEPSGGLTATHTAPISLGGADPQKTIYVVVRASSSVSSGKVIVGGTEYPLTVHHTVTMAGGNNRMALLSAAIPVGGTATLSVTTSGTWTGALTAYVLATKNMTLVTSASVGITMTAGTAITQTATTQVGDHLLAAVMAAPYDAAGIFGSPVAVTERLDQPLTATGPQLWVGTGVETAAASPRSVQVTPSQPGNAIRLIAQFRSV